MCLCISLGLPITILAQFDYPTEVLYDSSWTYKNLKLVPVKFIGDPGIKKPGDNASAIYLTLPDAMRQKKVTIRELKNREGAERSVLVVKNLSKDSIFLTRGDVVSGGKQDRMLAQTSVLPPGKKSTYVDVYCVEKGRWDKKPKSFTAATAADHELKKVMDTRKTQNAIWRNIDDRYRRQNIQTENAPYRQIAKPVSTIDSGYVKFFMNKFLQSDRLFCGFIAVTGNTIISTDLYATTDMQTVNYQGDLTSYIDVAIQKGNTPVIENKQVAAFIKPILSDEKTRNAFLQNRGRVFRQNNKIIHITAYGD